MKAAQVSYRRIEDEAARGEIPSGDSKDELESFGHRAEGSLRTVRLLECASELITRRQHPRVLG